MPSCAAPDETRIPTVCEIMLDKPKISLAPRRRQAGVEGGEGRVDRKEEILGFKIKSSGVITSCLLSELARTLLPVLFCPVLSGL